MSLASGVLEGAHRVTAVLGPTNTGKTHRAIQAMLQHRSGMIGLPLRLLAREVYDRVVAERGPDVVALITGEEKIVPRDPRYFVCTVEAMPLDLLGSGPAVERRRPVAFVAVDEVQLAGDRNRGHVFTDRLLHARGVLETMLLGSDTMAPLLEQLIPSVRIERQPRLSQLSWAGCSKLGSVPRRSAVVAFSAEQVYAHAERLRARFGGAAVVLGALSPRTRNAQVAMYQAGEVQHLVATDAIGMGLNMDVRHVAFTATRKFDGRGFRDLTTAELAQIAGRAGRYTTDGTFGTTREVGPLDPGVIDALQRHDFPPVTRLYWRNSALDTRSPEALLRSLRRPAPHPALVQVRDEDDELAFEALARREELALDHPDAVELAWEVCQIPDYRKTLTGSHVELLAQVAGHLLGPEGRLPDDWVAERIGRLDQIEGDIETLMARIAYVRTWTYVSFQRDWLADPAHWQERTRAIEDRLSDALHDRLTRRFVDQRLMLVTSAPEGAVQVDEDTVRIGPHVAGYLQGLDLRLLAGASGLYSAVRRGLTDEVVGRVARLEQEPDEALILDDRHRIRWRDGVLGWLEAGPGPLEPRVRLARLDLLEPPQKEVVRRRLERWRDAFVGDLFAPLQRQAATSLQGPGRGLLYALQLGLGSVPRQEVSAQLGALSKQDRSTLARLDVRMGTESVYVKSLLRPEPMAHRARLWCVAQGVDAREAPQAARSSVPADPGDAAFYRAVGYQVLGGLAVRVDVLERVAARLRELARTGKADGPDLLSWMGCKREDLDGVARALGYRVEDAPDGRIRARRLAARGAGRRQPAGSRKVGSG